MAFVHRDSKECTKSELDLFIIPATQTITKGQWTQYHPRVRTRLRKFAPVIAKLFHIMGTAPILEMAHAYGLRPRLWLLS